MKSAARSAGFSLIELLVATALAVLLAGAVSGSVVAAQALVGRSQKAGGGVAAAAACYEKLRSLPFCAAGTAAATLTQSVFPHADAALNDARSWFAPAAQEGCAPGTFFSTSEEGGTTLLVAATYCLVGSDGWVPLPPDRLTQYSPASPPSAAMLVRVRAVDGHTDPIVGVLTAGQASTDDPEGSP